MEKTVIVQSRLPATLADAIRDEAWRQRRRPGHLVADWARTFLSPEARAALQPLETAQMELRRAADGR